MQLCEVNAAVYFQTPGGCLPPAVGAPHSPARGAVPWAHAAADEGPSRATSMELGTRLQRPQDESSTHKFIITILFWGARTADQIIAAVDS